MKRQIVYIWYVWQWVNNGPYSNGEVIYNFCVAEGGRAIWALHRRVAQVRKVGKNKLYTTCDKRVSWPRKLRPDVRALTALAAS